MSEKIPFGGPRLMSRSLSSIFALTSKDKAIPPCFGTYMENVFQCQICEWKKECMEEDGKEGS